MVTSSMPISPPNRNSATTSQRSWRMIVPVERPQPVGRRRLGLPGGRVQQGFGATEHLAEGLRQLPTSGMAARGGMGNARTCNSQRMGGARVKASHDHILTSHVGSLPRPDRLIAANPAYETGQTIEDTTFQRTLSEAVAEVVRRQRDIGIDVPGDGEFGKAMGHRCTTAPWWSYSFGARRPRPAGPGPLDMPRGEVEARRDPPDSFADRRDRSGSPPPMPTPIRRHHGPRRIRPRCVGPSPTPARSVAADIANFKAALAAAGIERAS